MIGFFGFNVVNAAALADGEFALTFVFSTAAVLRAKDATSGRAAVDFGAVALDLPAMALATPDFDAPDFRASGLDTLAFDGPGFAADFTGATLAAACFDADFVAVDLDAWDDLVF